MDAARIESVKPWAWGVVVGGLLAGVVLLARAASPVPEPCVTDSARAPSPEYPVVHSPDSWRIGVGVSAAADLAYWLPRLGVGWYVNWGVADPPACPALVHWPMVRVHAASLTPSLAEISALAARRPGQTWIVGNEPDVTEQDGVTPVRFAQAYHDVYAALKTADPTARVAVGGVTQATPLRLRYLDAVLAAYSESYGELLPADVWTVHGYVLNEGRGEWGAGLPPGLPDAAGSVRSIEEHGSMDLFAAQLRAFRAWMTERGYRDRPLALTEFGILLPPQFGYPPERVAAFMDAALEFLRTARHSSTGYLADDNRLVQRWAWFSLADDIYPAADLLSTDRLQLSLLGEHYRRAAQEEMP